RQRAVVRRGMDHGPARAEAFAGARPHGGHGVLRGGRHLGRHVFHPSRGAIFYPGGGGRLASIRAYDLRRRLAPLLFRAGLEVLPPALGGGTMTTSLRSRLAGCVRNTRGIRAFARWVRLRQSTLLLWR